MLILINCSILYSQSKLSPNARLLLDKIKNEKFETSSDILSINKVGALIKVNDANVERDLLQLNVAINTRVKNIWSIRIPISSLDAVSKLVGLDYLELDEPVVNLLDQSRKLTKVDSVQLGTGLDQQGYTGKNVIVGIVDNGFDYTHPVFYDTLLKKLKIVRLWNQKTVGIPPSGFSYGCEYSSANQILDLKRDDENMTHGTHVAGIAAGNGTGSGGLYKGIAPDAEIVLVSRVPSMVDAAKSTGFSNLIDGINYVFNYAESIGKPAVVNLSLGNLTGPHDGSSLFSEACNNLSGKGKIIVFAAGNSNQTNAHFDYQFSASDTIFKTFVSLSKTQQSIWIDCWGEPNKNFSISVSLFDSLGNRTTANTEYISTKSDTTIIIGIKGSDDSLCTVDLVSSAKEANGKPRVFMNIKKTSKDKLVITGIAKDGSINMWNSYIDGYSGYNVAFSSNKYTWAKDGNNKITISDFACGDSVITVGAYISKNNWYTIEGQNYGYWGYTVGKIAPFSSLGPTTDGKMKPDISAPGMVLASAVSSFDTSYYKGGSNRNSSVKSYKPGDKEYLFATMMGTSMAAPVVTGIVALMLEKKADLTPSEIKYIFKRTAIIDANVGDTNTWGNGKVNAYQSLLYLEGKVDVRELISKELNVQIYPNPNNGRFIVQLDENSPDENSLELFDIFGTSKYRCKLESLNSNEIELKYLPSGSYTMKIINGKNVINRRLVIY